MKNMIAAAMLAGAACILPVSDALAWNPAVSPLQSVSLAPALSVQAPQQADRAGGAAGRSAATEDGTTASASKWRGMVGGVLAGLGLGAMLAELGIGGSLGGIVAFILVIALIAFILTLVVRLARRPQQDFPPMREPVLANGHVATGPAMRSEPAMARTTAPRSPAVRGQSAAAWGVPADFDVPGFLRHAKAYFIRLQASWDKSDVNDIREFTTAEMFAELTLQLHERGSAVSQTSVAILNADLIGVETTGTDYLASVKFSGMIKESGRPMAEPFIEIWSLSRPVAGQGNWLLAGIQQLQ